MKTTIQPSTHPAFYRRFNNRVSFETKKWSNGRSSNHENSRVLPDLEDLIEPDVLFEMRSGSMPDLGDFCQELTRTFFTHHTPYSATQFIPVFKNMAIPMPYLVDRFIESGQDRQVIVENELLKVVLIHWKPGQTTPIHGHPSGGCVFTVLRGQVRENRYSPEDMPRLLSSTIHARESLAYLDDRMALHAVSNPTDKPAVTLHAYTPGTIENEQ